MHKEIPYLKILRLAIVTAPLFGLFGATPVFVLAKMDLSTITKGFLMVTSSALIFWTINVCLLWLSYKFNLTGKDWIRYGLSIIICGLVIYPITSQAIAFRSAGMSGELPKEFPPAFAKDFPKGFPLPAKGFLLPVLQAESINIIIIVLLELLLLRQNKLKVETENTQLRMANLEAKHNLLKQQLHPHFLFNSLSTLRSLIKRSPEQAEGYLLKLSELLRFSTTNNFQSLVLLQEEVELCMNYLNMQQVRFGQALTFNIDIPKEMQLNAKVPVYSIQLLVENAIKHNILTVAQPLHICISGNSNEKNISVTNNLQKKLNMEESSGVGLSNLTERYQLLIDEGISINQVNGEFYVTIKVLDYESSNC
jgi:two-component system, LytTR family, sensor kinase